MTPPPVSETAASEHARKLVSNHERVAMAYKHLGATELGDAERAVLDYFASLESELLRLRADNERLTKERDEMRHAPWRRWSVQECDEDGSLLVCKGHHDRSAPCEFEEYIPKALYIHRRAESFLVRATTSRSRVSDNGE